MGEVTVEKNVEGEVLEVVMMGTGEEGEVMVEVGEEVMEVTEVLLQGSQ